MTSYIVGGVNWFKDLNDLTHHGVVLSGTAAGVAFLRNASPTGLAATAITMIGTQLGTHAWIGFLAGPTMFLNMKSRRDFGDIQARLFPKMGMVGTSTSLLALGAYHFAHPTPDKMTKLLSVTAISHVIQSFVLIPVTTYFQYEMRRYEEGSPEFKKEAMKFGIAHSFSVFFAYAAMAGNVWFLYSIGKRVARVW